MTGPDPNIRIIPRRDISTGPSTDDDRKVPPVPPSGDFRKVLNDDDKESRQAVAKKQAAVKKKPFTADKDSVSLDTDEEQALASKKSKLKGQKNAEATQGELTGELTEETAGLDEVIPAENLVADENPFIPQTPAGTTTTTPTLGDVKPKDSPFTLYKQTAAQKVNPQPLAWQSDIQSDTDAIAPPKKDKGKDKIIGSAYQEASSDIASVNPLAQVGVPVATVGDAPVEPTITGSSLPSDLQIVVEKLVKELYVVEQSGRSDTIVVLNNPPMFKDAQIVITSFNTATKEFNLSFENLTAPAKQLIDANLPALRIDLESKGFANAVHIITTTTQVEHNVFAGGEGEGRERREGGRQGGRQQDRGNR